jgi:hypothetical protein
MINNNNEIIDTHLVSSRNVTQPLHILNGSICNKTGNAVTIAGRKVTQPAVRRGNECSMSVKHSAKTLTMSSNVAAHETKQISHIRNSSENTATALICDDEYRSTCVRKIHQQLQQQKNMNYGADFDYRDISDNNNNNNNPQMPSSSHNVQTQFTNIDPVSLTNNVIISDANAIASSQLINVVPCTSSVVSQNNRKDNSECMSVECHNSVVTESDGGNIADNLIITSAITTTAPTAKVKYSNECVTMREKRRRDRRDRRLARTRGTVGNEILPDVLNNPRPPPYSSLPPQTPVIPSIISTVPVEDTGYTFSLPLVRR